MIRIATFSLIAVVVIVVAVLGWRGKKSTDPPFQPFMDMFAQPRYEPQGASRFFADGRSQRPPPTNTVAWGRNPQQADAEFVARDEDLFALQHIPLPLDRALILRGQQKYDLFCTVCHGGTGAGNGITTQYGMNAPPSYHTDRLRAITDGGIFQVISNGKGQMGPYGDRIARLDRWAIVAYVRALQRSHVASAEDVPDHLENMQPAE
jgi:mono/diheme cytochrome c family protein